MQNSVLSAAKVPADRAPLPADLVPLPANPQIQELSQLITRGKIEAALKYLQALPTKDRQIEAILILEADALRLGGYLNEALDKYTGLAKAGGSLAHVFWQRIAECHARKPDLEAALVAMRKSLSINSNNLAGHVFMAKMLFMSARYLQGQTHAKFILEHSEIDGDLAMAENIFRFSQNGFLAYQAARKRVLHGQSPTSKLGVLMVAAAGVCDWDAVDLYSSLLNQEFYPKNDFSTAPEIPLYNISYCKNEKINLSVASNYTKDILVEPGFDLSKKKFTGKIKVGLLSGDFANHPVIQTSIGLFEHLNKDKFELYAYNDGENSRGEHLERLNQVLIKHVDVRAHSYQGLAEMIYKDDIDIIIDLMGITSNARLQTMMLRPAPVTVTYLGFPGSTGIKAIDYALTDARITPDSSKEFYAEKLCRLPEIYYCTDNKRLIATDPITRAEAGLPEDAFVFCSFNRPFKLDKNTFSLWMQILKQVPKAVLWQAMDDVSVQNNLRQAFKNNGLDENRLIFAPKVASTALHMARARLADLALDTLIYNGHTITMDMLWAGVPVLTCKGQHYASRVSESMLNAIGLPEMITANYFEYMQKAVYLTQNPDLLQATKAKLKQNTKIFPLYDTERFTRHFETALQTMYDRAKQGLAPDHIDVPALPPRQTEFLPAGPPELLTKSKAFAYVQVADALNLASNPFYIFHGACPVCNAKMPETSISTSIDAHPHWQEPLPPAIIQANCKACGHLFTVNFWTKEAKTILNASSAPTLTEEDYALAHRDFSTMLHKVVELCGGSKKLMQNKLHWLDVGCGNGALPLLALNHGFAAMGIDTRSSGIELLKKIQISAAQVDFLSTPMSGSPNIISFCNTLEEFAYPSLALDLAYQLMPGNGILVVETTNFMGQFWNFFGGIEKMNLFKDPNRLHIFDRSNMVKLITNSGFKIRDCIVHPYKPMHIFIFAQKFEEKKKR